MTPDFSGGRMANSYGANSAAQAGLPSSTFSQAGAGGALDLARRLFQWRQQMAGVYNQEDAQNLGGIASLVSQLAMMHKMGGIGSYFGGGNGGAKGGSFPQAPSFSGGDFSADYDANMANAHGYHDPSFMEGNADPTGNMAWYHRLMQTLGNGTFGMPNAGPGSMTPLLYGGQEPGRLNYPFSYFGSDPSFLYGYGR